MRFTLPRDLYHEKGALEALKTLTGKEAIVVVGSRSVERFGFLDKVADYLKEAGMGVQLFEGVKPDPSVNTILKGAAATQEFEPDWIVAVGGGSPVNTVKAMWAFYGYPDTSFENLITPFSFPTLRTRAKFYATSSISGTATEITTFSVITDYKKGIKYPLADFDIAPDVAIVNPALAETMPRKLITHIGMDAIAHAIEAYVSALHRKYTDPLTPHTIEMINEYLIPSYNEDMEARDKIHDAQCLAGMAFPNALLRIVHSMAHKAGAIHFGDHIVHGCANAIYLLKVIKLSSKEPEVTAKYTKIAKFINLPSTMDEELTDALIARLSGMSKTLNIPAYMKGYEGGIIDKKEFADKLPKITELTVDDACTGSNPRTIIPEVMKQLLRCYYYDEEVDF